MEKDSQCTIMRYRQEEATNRLQATEDGPLNCSYFRIPSHISLGICSKFPFLRSTLQQERKEGSVLAVRLVLEKLLPWSKAQILRILPLVLVEIWLALTQKPANCHLALLRLKACLPPVSFHHLIPPGNQPTSTTTKVNPMTKLILHFELA